MSSADPVHPLRISKDTPKKSPIKMASAIPRPLSEISPSEKRRNSPSWTQTSNKKGVLSTDSSPFQSSPVEGAASPRLFWQNRGGINNENGDFFGRNTSPSPTRRTSIERLQKASRVKNSNILALEQKQEYDPSKLPQIERPLAKVQGNAYGGTGLSGLRAQKKGLGHHRNESKTSIPLYTPDVSEPAPAPATFSAPKTPTKDQGSPIKSSMSASRFKSSFDPETGTWSGDTSGDEKELPEGKSLSRHPKSVTFDNAPPQVNEYEMATPDLSSVGTNSREGSYESEEDEEQDAEQYLNGDAHGHDDSFDASLEDTDKTPVFGPDDWRQDSPEVWRDRMDNQFERSPMPEDVPQQAERAPMNRTDSSNSNGDHRPLPPLPPGTSSHKRSDSTSSAGLSATAERMLGAHRSLPSPPPALSSKSDIQNIGNGKMTLEERLKLMMLSDDGKTAAEQQRERRMRRAGARDRAESQTPERDVNGSAAGDEEDDDTIGDLLGPSEFAMPPRISRESILRRVDGNKATERESGYRFSSPIPSSPERRLAYDPDVPIPSTEVDDDDVFASDKDGVDLPPMIGMSSGLGKHNEKDSLATADDSDSQYSDNIGSGEGAITGASDEVTTTPRAGTPAEDGSAGHGGNQLGKMMPDLSSHLKKDDFSHGFESYMVSDQQPTGSEAQSTNDLSMADARDFLQRPDTPERQLSKPEYDGSGWGDEDEFEEPGTPDSVIHNPMHDFEEEARDSPGIPEQVATIKASGSKLKTRASATPSDLMAMREARRQVSREIPNIPPIPERHRNRQSRDMDAELLGSQGDEFLERHPSFKNRSLTLELDLGLSLDQDFERVIEAQKVNLQQSDFHPSVTAQTARSPTRQASSNSENSKSGKPDKLTSNTNITSRKQRGYLMRQNTKLVAAKDEVSEDPRGARSAGNSPIKKDRPQSWTVQPWNGQIRKQSVRQRTGPSGPVPPLPGQASNAVASGLSPLTEEELAAEMAPVESGERGRLFIKVMGVKDLDLPIPKNERTWFSLTLDNGVHCVTTAWLEMARNAPIGQEFELVVPNDLEFQLTLNVKLEKPAPKRMIQSPSKSSKPKTSAFSRVFASPKKRKELELRQREEEERQAQQQREAQSRQMTTAPTAWDLLSPLAAEDGSFARSYVCLKEHENRCFGRPYLVEIACFNEWATEEAGFASSVKSKLGNSTSVVRRAPYKIGKLELQLLFVPRPKGITDDDMPKSMNSCIREMKAAEERLSRNWEGHLSQQGGDCPYWRRRFFRLVGAKLTAYHEATRQPRATINLANAKRLIDDRQALTEKETMGKGGKRRRSAFAEEEEGYMFVEEGFRIRFNNGEVIDFYADNKEDKEGWMRVLSDVVGRDSLGSSDGDSLGSLSRAKGKWCELVLKREEALRRRAEGRRVHSRTKSMHV